MLSRYNEFVAKKSFLETGLGVFLIFILLGWLKIRASAKPPQLFPINRPDGEYLITQEYDYYMVKYKGPEAWNVGKDANGYTTVVVGETKYDLSRYLDKKVRITSGNFATSQQQCITVECKDFAGPMIVIGITGLTE